MHGKILTFSSSRSSGAIQSEQGGRFDFDIAAVLAYDVAGLAEGQAVNFEPDGGSPHKAVNVSVLPPVSIHYSEDRYREIRRLRYVGFEQRQNIRTYRFERFTPGELTEEFSVDTDMALFTRHKLRLQEGPLLCLHLLMTALGTQPAGESSPYSLTEQHMLAFLATRTEPSGKPGPKTGLRP